MCITVNIQKPDHNFRNSQFSKTFVRQPLAGVFLA